MLNTHYFSHYNKDYGKQEEHNVCEEAIGYIEKSLSELKIQQ